MAAVAAAGQAIVQYWDTYVTRFIAWNAQHAQVHPQHPPIPPGIPRVTPPVLQLGIANYNGAVAIDNARYNIVSANPIDERGLGVFVGFAQPDLPGNPGQPDPDPNRHLCVYAKVINPKLQKTSFSRKGPKPPAKDRRRLQLRVKHLTYRHEPPQVGTWNRRDNILFAERELIPLRWFTALGTTLQKVQAVERSIAQWNAQSTTRNRVHLNHLRVSSTTGGALPQLPV